MTLRIQTDPTVVLEGYLEGDALRFRHGDQELSDHGNQVEIVGADQARVVLRVPSGVTRVQHEGADGLVSWSRQGEQFEYTLVSATDPDEIEAAGDGDGPRTTIHIKVTPKGGLPDR